MIPIKHHRRMKVHEVREIARLPYNAYGPSERRMTFQQFWDDYVTPELMPDFTSDSIH